MRCRTDNGVIIITEFPVPFQKDTRYCMVQCDGEPVSMVSFPASSVEECPANWIMV
jgi:hypothetical protein